MIKSTSEKLIRIKKYNSSVGAICCSKCNIILKEGFLGNIWAEEVHKKQGTYPGGLITKEDWKSEEPMFCDNCLETIKNVN